MYAMRPLRNFKTNQCCHLISRIANRAFFLNDEEKTRFVERLWRVAAFSCVEALAYCFMSNHFHILVYVPDPRELSDDELLARIRALYSGTAMAEIEKEWELLTKVGGARGSRNRQRELFHGPLPDAACEVGLHRGCRRREESLSARQAVQDSAQGKGGGLCLTPPLQPHHWGLTLGVPLKPCVTPPSRCTRG